MLIISDGMMPKDGCQTATLKMTNAPAISPSYCSSPGRLPKTGSRAGKGADALLWQAFQPGRTDGADGEDDPVEEAPVGKDMPV